ncbi:LOW QUALITY PROTEIN: muscular LMNA-interacting protein [Lates calcarifer]|uniref:LOW QUALITY PROTEIN: muscular LMNA-interacting protein n=1 Tax=Lates calcarifer TaxID=8187 RepID=A0AAJ7Q326_LATCA|nr:LOW QUALITY PROTEIN: muscular LMNA-interacting protein [Lates calcarifer]
MDSLNKSVEKVSIGAPPKPSFFTFVPVVHKLPFKSIITEEGERSGAGKPNKIVAVSHEKTSKETMSDGEIFKAELVFIKDSVGGGAGNVIKPETEHQPSLDHMSLSHTKASPSVSVQSENTPNHVATRTDSMETAADKHRGISQRQCHDTSGRAEVSSGCFANRVWVSEDRTSPTNSADLFPTLASSRESILSEGLDIDKSWSAVQLSSVTSPLSLSCTVSPCSSVRSGIFTPAVTQIKKHFLAPGSSLVHIPQSCFSSCESLSSSVCPQSSPPRHRPPLTRLSLLTAILRKGRLPVLSSALQRPYTPCWPVNPVTLSFCNACSAASSVASIPLEFSSRFSSSASIDSQSNVHRETNRCVTAPPPVQSNELSRTCPQTQVKRCSEQIRSSSVPRWEQLISPTPVKSNAPPQAPLPLLCSNFKSLSPAEREKMLDCRTSKNLQHTHISYSKAPDLNPATLTCTSRVTQIITLRLISLSPKLTHEQETSAPQKWSHSPNSSLSRLQLLSQKLRTPPVCPPQLQPLQSHAPGVTIFPTRTNTASPLPASQNTKGRCESERSCPGSQTATPSQSKAHCLSPSRYTPISFPGWPSPTSSPTPTPSPAPPIRDLTPSPSLSLRSTTPSPRPGSGISDCSDREGKKRKTHKIKLSYKSLAAIPTNTLLLDQQAIDEQVEREDSPCDILDRGVTLDRGDTDTHAEMCSPAQLRQQSEELYAVIDEILANSIPAPSRSSTTNVGVQRSNSPFSKSLGRETKYASLCSLHPSAGVERKLMDPRKTKPGVIRPMTAIPRLTVEDEEEFHPNPFKQSVIKQTLTDNKKVENMSPKEAGKDLCTSSKGVLMRDERKPDRNSPFSLCNLQITEPEDQISRHAKDASFSPTKGRMEAFETHI